MPKGNDMFEDFWKVWPSNPRKGAKSKCKQVWIKSYCDTQADQIIKHVQWLKTTEQWLKANGAFIPAPLVYLNQQRWDGAEVPDVVAKQDRDPVLVQMEIERKKATVMPDDIRAKLAALRGRT